MFSLKQYEREPGPQTALSFPHKMRLTFFANIERAVQTEIVLSHFTKPLSSTEMAWLSKLTVDELCGKCVTQEEQNLVLMWAKQVTISFLTGLSTAIIQESIQTARSKQQDEMTPSLPDAAPHAELPCIEEVPTYDYKPVDIKEITDIIVDEITQTLQHPTSQQQHLSFNSKSLCEIGHALKSELVDEVAHFLKEESGKTLRSHAREQVSAIQKQAKKDIKFQGPASRKEILEARSLAKQNHMERARIKGKVIGSAVGTMIQFSGHCLDTGGGVPLALLETAREASLSKVVTIIGQKLALYAPAAGSFVIRRGALILDLMFFSSEIGPEFTHAQRSVSAGPK